MAKILRFKLFLVEIHDQEQHQEQEGGLMSVKDYLHMVQELEQKIDEQQDYLFRLRESLTSISVQMNPNKVQASHDDDKIGQIMSTVIDGEKNLDEMKREFCVFRCKVIEQIHSMTDLNLKQILMMRYVGWKDCGTLKEVAVRMNYSYDYIKELHAKALSEFKSILQTP